MSTKHTPGPWEWHTYPAGCYLASSKRHKTHARTPLKGVDVIVGIDVKDDQSNASELSADAHLIRTAPELLAALRAFTDEYEATFAEDYEGTPLHDHYKQAKATIAKATKTAP